MPRISEIVADRVSAVKLLHGVSQIREGEATAANATTIRLLRTPQLLSQESVTTHVREFSVSRFHQPRRTEKLRTER